MKMQSILWRRELFLGLLILGLRCLLTCAAATTSSHPASFGSATSNPNNIHAVIVSSSRYWFNYRHFVNALSIYQVLKENGVPDSNIVLMLADEIPANARNPYKNGMYSKGVNFHTVYNATTEIDYRGGDVTVQNLFHVLLGTSKGPASNTAPPSRVLHSDRNSNVLIYMTGHGGDQFFKFQDEEEITADDFANLMDAMYLRRRYKKVLFLTDTCQAFTLADKVTSPDVYTVASSLRDESAYAHHSDPDLGLAVIERYTHSMIEYYYNYTNTNSSVHDVLVEPFLNGAAPRLTKKSLGANIGVKDDLGDVKLSEIPMSDFFGPKRPSTLAEKRLQQLQQKRDGSTSIPSSEWKDRRMLVLPAQPDMILRPPQPMHHATNNGLDVGVKLEKVSPDNPTTSPDTAIWEPSSPEFVGLLATLGVLVVTLALWDRRETLDPSDEE